MELPHEPVNRVKRWVEIAVAAALGAVLSLVKVYTLPQGGSVTVTTLPILFLALWRGPGTGATAGMVLGLLKLVLGPIVVHPVQILLDYPVPFALLGVAGFFPRYPAMGVLAGSLCRGASHVLSGVVFFASYAPPGVNVWKYSLVYNASYVLPEALLCIALVPILLRRVAGAEYHAG
ncbi:MAG: energy-coupled thiamine transporter ThiT [Candidatus Latescibacteria bacterium]|nr:energy-coupled thiamine transporter ThiT [Candidatus Latescibacterota bacterium]